MALPEGYAESTINPSVTKGLAVTELEYKHRDYVKFQPKWQVCRDLIEGEDAVKRRTTVYLPKPSGQSSAEYSNYLVRAPYFNAMARTHDAMRGLVRRKAPVLTASERVKDLAEHITAEGTSLVDFSMLLMAELLTVYRAGILAEFPKQDNPAPTLQEVEDAELRPYLALYTAENIYDWRETFQNGRKKLTYLKLHETMDSVLPDNTVVEGHQYRIFWINEQGECQFRVVQWDGSKAPVDVTPNDPFIYIQDKRIGFIPCTFCGPLTSTSQLAKPPLYDLACVSIHHYQAGADRANAVHWADSPTPVFIGTIISQTGEEVTSIKLGSTTAVNLALGGDAKYLEFQGNGLGPTKELMAEYKEEMALLGSKILSADSRAAEVAATAAIHRAGENSVLAAMANSMSASITRALELVCRFQGWQEELSYRLTTDFYPTPMDSQTLIALIGAIQAAKISEEEFYEALVEGEIIRSDKSFKEHKEEIDRMPKPPAPVAAASGNTFGTPSKTVGAPKTGEAPKT